MSDVVQLNTALGSKSEWNVSVYDAVSKGEFVLIIEARVEFNSEKNAIKVYQEHKLKEVLDLGVEFYSINWLDCRGSKSKTILSSHQKVYSDRASVMSAHEGILKRIRSLKK